MNIKSATICHFISIHDISPSHTINLNTTCVNKKEYFGYICRQDICFMIVYFVQQKLGLHMKWRKITKQMNDYGMKKFLSNWIFSNGFLCSSHSSSRLQSCYLSNAERADVFSNISGVIF